MSYNYVLTVTFTSGRSVTTTYDKMLDALGVSAEVVCGQPLSAGGCPQVQAFMTMVKKASKGEITKIEAFYNGNLLLVA